MASYTRALARHRPVSRHMLLWVTACAILFVSLQAHAQPGSTATTGAGDTATHICQKASTSKQPTLNGSGCDVRWRDLKLTYQGGDKEREIARDAGRCTGDCSNMNLRSIEGARPPKDVPLKHITTPLKSLIKDYSPFLYYNLSLSDLDDDEKQILRRLYRGTKGDSRSAFSMVSTQRDAPPSQAGVDEETKQFAQCVDQIRTPSDPTSPEEWAKLVRLKLDNCANQYILFAAIDPAHKENVTKYSYDDPANPTKKIGLYSHCQPLKILPDGKNEYHASEYIMGAWKKMMQEPNYRINDKAAKEPRLPQNIDIANKINPPSSVPDVRLSMIATTPYEEIIDPTHPFSPRWDFEYNERDQFSPLTTGYGGDAKNAVFCAGDKSSKIYKVDVLRFRDETIKFSEKIKQRIDYNSNCKAGKGLQAKPCCLPYIDGPPNSPTSYKCRMMPCKVCFAFSADKPACSTSYSGNPDRKSIVPTFLPVSPQVRMMGQISQMAQSMQNMQMPASINVQQFSSMLNSNMSMLNSFAPNLPISSLSGIMNGQLSLTTNLSGMLNGQINMGNLGSLMGAQGNIFSSLGNLNPSQLQGLMSGQLNIMASLPGNLNLGQMSSFLQAPSSLLSSLPQNLNFSQVTGALNLQGNILNNFGGINVQSAMSQLGNVQNMIQTLPANMNLNQLSANITTQIPGFGQLNINNLTVGDLRNAITSGQAGLQGFNPTQMMSQVGPAIQSSIGAITQLPGNLSVQNVSSFLSSTTANFSQMPNLNLSNVTASLQTQFGSVSSTLGGLSNLNLTSAPQQMAALFSGQGNLLSGLPSGMNIGALQGMVSSQLGNIMSLGANFNVGQLSSFLGSQMGGLQGLSGLTSLSSLGGLQGLNSLASLSNLGNLGGSLGSMTSAFGGLGGGLGSSLSGVGGMSGLASSGALKSTNPCSAGKDVIYLFCAGDVTNKAYCRPDELKGQNTSTMESQCEKLRAPLTPLNKLKMRYHDPAKTQESELPSGVPEGLQFNDYFKDADTDGHMPYMRLHDTGRSIQTSTSTSQDPMDNKGQFTAVVGVGREGISGDSEHKDQRCLLGGWGEDTSFAGISVKKNDPVTSWTELKLYQARGARKDGVYCIGRYDKVYKPESTEERVLNLLGGKINVLRALTGNADSKRATVVQWPLSWRGYIMDTDDATRFPNFGGNPPTLRTGLDEAQPGDVILLPKNGSGTDQKPGLARVGVVTKLSRNKNCGNDCWVTVVTGDDGGAPDTCGMTDAMGQVVTRYLHKPGASESLVEDDFEDINSDMSCEDQNLQHCVLSTWDEIQVFNPRKNVRSISAAEAKNPTGGKP